MKFMMIFEGVDRATRVMNKIMAAEKKVAAASKAGAQASDRANSAAARTAEKLALAYSKVSAGSRVAFAAVVSGAQAAGRATAALHRQTVQLAKAGIGQIGSGAGKVFRGLTLAAGIATAAFGTSALAAGHLVGTASQFEKFQTILETTEGSSAKAKSAMGWVSDFAVNTPYELDQVMGSFVALRARGLDPTNGLLEKLGDTSAAMGTPLMQAVEAMADAVTGENERLKEFGIVASKTGNKITYEYTNAAGKMMQATVGASDRMAIQAKLMSIFGEKYGGAMKKLSATWDGMTANIADVWKGFELAIMNAGLFAWMEDKLSGVLDFVNQLKVTGQLDAWAKQISDNIIWVLESAWEFGKGVWKVMEKLGGYLKIASEYVGGWEQLAAILAALAFAPVLISTAAGIVQIAMGLSMLSAALIANPVVLVIAAIAAGAIAIYMNWGRIKTFFIDLWNGVAKAAVDAWNSIKASTSGAWEAVKNKVKGAVGSLPEMVSGAWERLKAILAWHPVALIVSNWGAIKGALSGAVSKAFSAVEEVWNKVKAMFDWSPVEAIKKAWAGISDAIGGLIGDAASRAGAAWDKVKSVFSFGGGDNVPAAATMPDPVNVQAETAAAMEKLTALDKAAAQIAPAVASAVRAAQTFLANISFYDQGAALMDTMAAGMKARAFVVIQEIQNMTQAVRDHLPSSPAKVGPLSDIHRLKFGETIAQSIRAEPMVKAMRVAAAATMAAAAVSSPHLAAASTASDAARSVVANSTTAREQIAAATASSSPAAGSTAPITVQLQQTIKWDGQTPPADMKLEFDRMLQDSARKLTDIIQEEMRRQARKEF